MKLGNQKGAILIITYMVFFVLLTLAAGFAITNFSEILYARRYNNTASAFWLAEAGISRYLRNPNILTFEGALNFQLGQGWVHLAKNDSNPAKRIVTSTATVAGVSKSIQIEYAANPPEVFNNTLSVNGDITIDGHKTSCDILDRIRLSGHVDNESKYSGVYWEDKKEGFNSEKLKITFPDADRNGKSDEFSDFVAYYRDLLSNYSRDDVIYVQGNGTYTLTPDQTIQTKKIIYVEGNEGNGDVVIQLNGSWKAGEKVTVISTGTVTFNQGGTMPPDSQLNIIAWSGYHETAVLSAEHRGVIYTHGIARFDNIFDTSITDGCVIAQGGIFLGDIWATKIFRYSDVRQDGILPPGFQGLASGNTPGYADSPTSWKEI